MQHNKAILYCSRIPYACIPASELGFYGAIKNFILMVYHISFNYTFFRRWNGVVFRRSPKRAGGSDSDK